MTPAQMPARTKRTEAPKYMAIEDFLTGNSFGMKKLAKKAPARRQKTKTAVWLAARRGRNIKLSTRDPEIDLTRGGMF